ncbi:MAG: adenosylmethionine decarboxylase [Candidatus Thiodiazotropha sp. (ex Dulcina madagascariensis)]|nr:adenosylmethionine decarboxylase [Candidatus Thiodiazotropha sp. (ex Dulcina madagascariensis)]MCU7928199.1 adenosylmethionine decarboxylase [Candidatus Thiodiazotropha sp. (ex Dulcina madagascariensis)]MCU7935453.1 adenosylmethionine decarboxylase [Candidatus Thiodiazotropha sp. (ex Dulcina madagascariensis)]
MLRIGRHLIIECQGRHAHLSEKALEALLVTAAEAGGASVLQAHFHPFGAGKGMTGVVLLAESHITVHTWPEYDYAAFDVFMCGDCKPMQAAEVITSACPDAVTSVRSIDRGLPINAGNVSANRSSSHSQSDSFSVG